MVRVDPLVLTCVQSVKSGSVNSGSDSVESASVKSASVKSGSAVLPEVNCD
jgi:hypothetical protein